jgi:hypothetical protein
VIAEAFLTIMARRAPAVHCRHPGSITTGGEYRLLGIDVHALAEGPHRAQQEERRVRVPQHHLLDNLTVAENR